MIGCAAAAAAAVPIYALAAPPGTKAPDLRADPVEFIDGPAVYSDTEGNLGRNRLLVRFDGFVTNVGDGPLEIRGNPQKPQTDPAGVKQYAWSASQGPGDLPAEAVGTPEVVFETADSHRHYHLKYAMKYSLWNLDKTAEVAPGQKVGFCLYDLDVAPQPRPVPDPQVYVEAVTHFCDWHDQAATSLRMGVSSGWRDIYDSGLAYQWVDVSQTSPGTYLVASEADPNSVIWEGGTPDRETNLRAFAPQKVTVPGYIASAASAPQTGAPQTIALSSTEVGNAGAVRYAIVTPPGHGTLGPISGASVTYTPDAGYSGVDSFSYSARDAASDFPLAGSEPSATVTLTAGAASIAISGTPASLIAGTSAQLSAAVSNASGGVTWSASAGTISPTGLFTAPATPPPGGTVTVRATSTALPALSTEVAIAITPVPVAIPAPQPTPNLPGPTTAATNRRLLSKIVLSRAGGRVLVATLATGPRAGRVTVTMTIGTGRVLGRCGALVGTQRTVSCKITVPRGYTLANIKATATIRVGGRVLAVRRVRLGPPRSHG